jgi:hypothetical protein
MENIFDIEITQALINRIEILSPTSKSIWGKMDVAQMLAHCNVAYQLEFENNVPKPKRLTKLILKLFVKNMVVNDQPYKKNNPTDPNFRIDGERDFGVEKLKLVAYLKKTQQLGEAHYNDKESHSFGRLTNTQWSNMFFKHIDHHLKQFGA